MLNNLNFSIKEDGHRRKLIFLYILTSRFEIFIWKPQEIYLINLFLLNSAYTSFLIQPPAQITQKEIQGNEFSLFMLNTGGVHFCKSCIYLFID
jgi:hypothetical protein